MKLLIQTETTYRLYGGQSLAQQFNKFDNTFACRYLVYKLGNAVLDEAMLEDEKHWESDKYGIFYVDVEDAKVDELVQNLDQQEWCYMVLPVDQEFNQIADPYFNKYFSKFKDYLPSNITEQGPLFKPRTCDPDVSL